MDPNNFFKEIKGRKSFRIKNGNLVEIMVFASTISESLQCGPITICNTGISDFLHITESSNYCGSTTLEKIPKKFELYSFSGIKSYLRLTREFNNFVVFETAKSDLVLLPKSEVGTIPIVLLNERGKPSKKSSLDITMSKKDFIAKHGKDLKEVTLLPGDKVSIKSLTSLEIAKVVI